MRKESWGIAVMFALLFAGAFPVFADPPQQNTSEETVTIQVPKSAIPPEVLKNLENAAKIKNYGAWVGLGKEVGVAINDGLGALTDQADKFAKTDVGRFTMWLIAFKVIGWPLVHIVGGIGFFIFSTILCFISYGLRMRVELDSDGKDGVAVFHWVAFAIITVFTLFIVFSG